MEGSLFKTVAEAAGNVTERKNPSPEKTEENLPPPVAEKNPAPTFFEPENEGAKKENLTEDKKEKAKQSGQTDAYLYSTVQDTILQLANLVWYVTRFTNEEKQRIVDFQKKKASEYSEADNSLNRKFLKINNKWEDNKAKINMSTEELEMLEKGFTIHAEVTGRETNPTMIITSVIVRSLCSKMMDIFI